MLVAFCLEFNMSRFLIVIIVSSLMIFTNGLNPNKCQEFPREKHCLIEYSVRERWPHTVRYVYNWYSKSCFEVRWSEHCPLVPEWDQLLSNNFPTEEQCINECGGWA